MPKGDGFSALEFLKKNPEWAYWMECETPQTDITGKRLETENEGKLGERFVNQHDNERCNPLRIFTATSSARRFGHGFLG